MKRALASVLILAGCTAGQVYETDVGALRVYYDDQNTYFTGPEVIDGFEIEPFPAPGSLVVKHLDGTDLEYSQANAQAADVAMNAYCEDQTGSSMLQSSSFQNERFAGLCAKASLDGATP